MMTLLPLTYASKENRAGMTTLFLEDWELALEWANHLANASRYRYSVCRVPSTCYAADFSGDYVWAVEPFRLRPPF